MRERVKYLVALPKEIDDILEVSAKKFKKKKIDLIQLAIASFAGELAKQIEAAKPPKLEIVKDD